MTLSLVSIVVLGYERGISLQELIRVVIIPEWRESKKKGVDG